ncbi:hypothetical protein HYW55_00285 [Candidatus Gottesmanbacteria bacterium]|nr:hypothetical protein [Candidatus Gottesmanbacteria bacterium]
MNLAKLFLVFIIGSTLFLLAGRINAVSAQVLKFELVPSQTLEAGGVVKVNILINTGGQSTTNADAMILFDPNKLSVNTTQFVAGSFYPSYLQKIVEGTTNKYLVSGYVKDISSPKSTSTDTLFATISLTALSAGTTQLSFDCTSGSTADSNINRSSDSSDIIQCPLSPLTLTVGSGDGSTSPTPTPPGGGQVTPTITPTATPTRTPTPTKTPTPTLSELPRTGTVETTFAAMGIGIVLTVVGVLLLL